MKNNKNPYIRESPIKALEGLVKDHNNEPLSFEQLMSATKKVRNMGFTPKKHDRVELKENGVRYALEFDGSEWKKVGEISNEDK